jgi:anti-sigma regulatory factor (Ser/Thr protein kinase)
VHHGIDRLRGHLERHHGEPLDALLDGLLTDMVGEHGDDDIAMLAVRSLAVDAAAHDEVVLELPPNAEAAAVARAVVYEHGSFLPEHLRQDTELLVSELVANAIRHGRPPITLHVRPHPPGILVAVRDEGPQLPVLPSAPPGPDQPTGRGLLIIAALAGAWGVVPADGVVGKTVWIDLGAE